MTYHVIHIETHELKIFTPVDVMDIDTDAEGRVVVYGKDQEAYYLLASKDLVTD